MSNYTITEEQIKDIAKGGGDIKIKEMFPEVFETKLEVGKWYKVDGDKCGKSGRKLLACFSGTEEDSNYGFYFMGTWNNDLSLYHKYINKITFAATAEEVKTALIAEAKKRGYTEFNFKSLEKQGSGFDSIFENWTFIANTLFTRPIGSGGKIVFKDGIWASIIKEKSLSKSEAEAKLTKLINDGNTYKIN